MGKLDSYLCVIFVDATIGLHVAFLARRSVGASADSPSIVNGRHERQAFCETVRIG